MIRIVFTDKDDVVGIITAYMAGIKVAFAIAIAGAGVGLFFCIAGRWKRLNSAAVKEALVVA